MKKSGLIQGRLTVQPTQSWLELVLILAQNDENIVKEGHSGNGTTIFRKPQDIWKNHKKGQNFPTEAMEKHRDSWKILKISPFLKYWQKTSRFFGVSSKQGIFSVLKGQINQANLFTRNIRKMREANQKMTSGRTFVPPCSSSWTISARSNYTGESHLLPRCVSAHLDSSWVSQLRHPFFHHYFPTFSSQILLLGNKNFRTIERKPDANLYETTRTKFVNRLTEKRLQSIGNPFHPPIHKEQNTPDSKRGPLKKIPTYIPEAKSFTHKDFFSVV